MLLMKTVLARSGLGPGQSADGSARYGIRIGAPRHKGVGLFYLRRARHRKRACLNDMIKSGEPGPRTLQVAATPSLPGVESGTEPTAGFEPATGGLRNRCSTAELRRPATGMRHRHRIQGDSTRAARPRQSPWRLWCPLAVGDRWVRVCRVRARAVLTCVAPHWAKRGTTRARPWCPCSSELTRELVRERGDPGIPGVLS